jgi:hypothetical protein
VSKGTFSVDLSVFEKGRKRPEYTLDSDLSGEITLEDLLKWTKATLIITADTVLKEEQDRGFDKQPLLLVDGRKGKDVSSVNPLGQIEFLARQDFGRVLVEAYEALLDRSKVLTGRYKASHYVFLNGQQVATDLATLKTWLKSGVEFKDEDRIRIVNIQPYARRLELLGVTAQRSKQKLEDKGRRRKVTTGVTIKVPNGAYQLTTRAIKSKYKNNVGIRFTFIPGSSMGLAGTFKGGRRGKNSAGRAYLYPSIVFSISERGIL